MKTILLRDPEVFPSEEVLKSGLGKSYAAYEELHKTLTDDKFGLAYEWNYYNDGKSWLCKVTFKKKTVFWLSVWEKHFKTGFYFTEKTIMGLSGIEPGKPIGKLIPVVINVTSKKQIKDVLKTATYKMSVK